MNNYKSATKIIVWIVALSTVAYFVLLPVSFTRPTPKTVSPVESNVKANPLESFGITTSTTSTTSTETTSSEINPIIPGQE
ncbi:MAG: hypothetical protein ACP5JU_01055 [Minisyncoccia bacterium]